MDDHRYVEYIQSPVIEELPKRLTRHNSDKNKRKKELKTSELGMDIPIRKDSKRNIVKFMSAPASFSDSHNMG